VPAQQGPGFSVTQTPWAAVRPVFVVLAVSDLVPDCRSALWSWLCRCLDAWAYFRPLPIQAAVDVNG
jgi:hypothetical protein